MNGPGRVWSRLPRKSRALFAVAVLLVFCATCLAGEGLLFRALATREEGIVVAHDRKGRPVVAYRWGGRDCRHEESGPSEQLAVGTAIGVYVPASGPSAARLDWVIGLLFLPVWFCLMPASFLAAYGVVVAIRRVGKPPNQLLPQTSVM